MNTVLCVYVCVSEREWKCFCSLSSFRLRRLALSLSCVLSTGESNATATACDGTKCNYVLYVFVYLFIYHGYI